MRFNRHSELADKHAFLSASKYHWINYSTEKMLDKWEHQNAAAYGSRMHQYAHDAISLGVKQRQTSQTVNMYINDCIGYRMSTEVTLMYSYNAFGTADAIGFGRDEDYDHPVLRIFDLKTGKTPVTGTQLFVYAAYFCLEYKVKPMQTDYDLRIYQNDDIHPIYCTGEDIAHVMGKVVEFDKLIERQKEMGV